MREMLIELDDIGELPDIAETSRPKRSLGLWGGLLVAALVLASLGGAAPVSPAFTSLGSLTEVPDGYQIRVVAGLILVLDGDRRLTAYQPDGLVRWTEQSDHTAWNITTLGDRIVSERIHESDEDVDVTTVVLDAVSGTPVWEAPGHLIPLGESPPPVAGQLTFWADDRIEVRQPESGALLWSTPPVGEYAVDHTGRSMLVVTADSRLSSYGLTTGELDWSIPLGVTVKDRFWMTISDTPELVGVTLRGADEFITKVYRRDTLEPVSLARELLPGDSAYRCGQLICTPDPLTPGVTLLIDPETGAEVRRLPRGHSALTLPTGILTITHGTDQTFAHNLLESRTGETVLTLDREVFHVSAYNNIVLPQQLVLIKKARPRLTYVGLLSAEGFQQLGVPPHVLHECDTAAGILACRVDGGELRVWQIN